jgi:hypothetical protein
VLVGLVAPKPQLAVKLLVTVVMEFQAAVVVHQVELQQVLLAMAVQVLLAVAVQGLVLLAHAQVALAVTALV